MEKVSTNIFFSLQANNTAITENTEKPTNMNERAIALFVHVFLFQFIRREPTP